ncbi:MAG: DUF4365 domain-containing protein, partial [Pirellulales bacterium]
MKRDSAKVIGKIASAILLKALSPAKWVVNSLEGDDDYAKDFLIERVEDSGLLSGESVFIQLKGTSKKAKYARGKMNCYSFQLKQKHALYYADKADQPVFLVLCLNSTERLYYVFVQPFLEQKQGWREQKSVAIHLPIANELSDLVSFELSVAEAKEWMRRKRPTSLKDAHDAAVERLKNIEPRCDYKVSFKENGHPQFYLIPLEDIPIKMRIVGKDNIDRFSKGELVHFKPGEVSLDGTALFDDIKATGAGIQAQHRRKCDLEMELIGSAGKSLGTLRDIRGEWRGGLTQTTFYGSLRRSPYTIESGPFA